MNNNLFYNIYNELCETVGNRVLNCDYWDCDCDDNYIHHNEELYCHNCGLHRDECSNSFEQEVEEYFKRNNKESKMKINLYNNSPNTKSIGDVSFGSVVIYKDEPHLLVHGSTADKCTLVNLNTNFLTLTNMWELVIPVKKSELNIEV